MSIDGTSAVEFAIIAPIVVTLFYGVIGVGWLIFLQMSLENGTEIAARCASVNPAQCGSVPDIRKYAAENAYGNMIPASAFTPSVASCGNTVAGTYQVRIPVLGAITLSTSSCFPLPPN